MRTHSGKKVVVYVDVPWAIGKDGQLDPRLATIEREIFGNDVELRFPKLMNGNFVLDGDGFLGTVTGADAIVICRYQVTEKLLANAGPSLKVIGRSGVGIDNLAGDLLERKRIYGFNVPDYCIGEVADHAVAMLGCLERGIIAQHLALASGKFDAFEGGIPRRLSNCTAGIVGFGRIGRAVAERLRHSYREIIAYDPHVSPNLIAAYMVTPVKDFSNFLRCADVVLLHCSLHEETVGLFNRDAFAQMKRTAFLVNTARGGVVDRESLYQAVRSRTIAGAAIDVFSPESPHDDEWNAKLIRLPNVVATCHRAYLSAESLEAQRRQVAENIMHVFNTGRPPPNGHITRRLE